MDVDVVGVVLSVAVVGQLDDRMVPTAAKRVRPPAPPSVQAIAWNGEVSIVSLIEPFGHIRRQRQL